jgi:acyl carrier protein
VTLTDGDVLAGIAEVARKHLGWEGRLSPELRLVEDLELDSLKMLTLALEVENHFRVRLDPEAGIETVGELVAAIRERLDD